MLKKALPLIAGVLCAPGIAASAESLAGTVEKPRPGVYIGAGAGRAALKVTVDGFSGSMKTHDVGFKLFGGWRFNENFSLEGSYVDLGQQEEREDDVSLRIEPRWFSASAIGTWPLKENFAVYARAGVARWDADFRIQNGLLVGKADDKGTELTYGVGLSSYLDGAVVRLEYERLDDATSSLFVENDSHGDLSLLSLSVAWKF